MLKPLQKIGRQRRPRTPITCHLSLITGVMLLACAGCSVPKILGDGNHATYFENYLRYERPFTDATAVAARKDAEGECSRRKKVAVETNSTCTLTRCTTIYQCMDKADAAGYR